MKLTLDFIGSPTWARTRDLRINSTVQPTTAHHRTPRYATPRPSVCNAHRRTGSTSVRLLSGSAVRRPAAAASRPHQRERCATTHSVLCPIALRSLAQFVGHEPAAESRPHPPRRGTRPVPPRSGRRGGQYPTHGSGPSARCRAPRVQGLPLRATGRTVRAQERRSACG